MTLTLPILQAGSYGAVSFLQYWQTLIAGPGVVGVGDLLVTANGTPNLSVNVAVGQAVMPGTLGATSGFPTNTNAQTTYGLPSTLTSQGSYASYQNGTVNLAISTPNPSNPRIDLICASVQDAQYSGSNNQAVLQVITGTPAATPVAPSAPASTVVLAQVAVAAAATSITSGNITDERPHVQLLNTLRGIPAGRVYYTGGGGAISGANIFATISLDYVVGGITQANSGLMVAKPGIYKVGMQAKVQFSASAAVGGVIFRNGNINSYGNTSSATPSTTEFPSATAENLIKCAAGDYFNAGVNCDATGTFIQDSGSEDCYLYAHLVSDLS